jgi:fermentation-respiration switch protein FrsA (DUF1100 family)
MLALGLAGGFSACTPFFFRPDNHLYNHPDRYDLAYETPRFKSSDGVTLAALLLKSRTQPARGIVVYFHGNAGNLTGHFPYASWLVDYGFDVLAFDYRGYGNSQGHPFPQGLVRDGVAALEFAAARPGETRVPIFVLGQSLGGAVAAAAVTSAKSVAIRAMALESPFSSYRSVVRRKLDASRAARWLLRPWLPWLVTDEASPIEAIKNRPRCPLVILHGTADRVVPVAEGLRLYDAAPEPKELWTIEGGDHVEAFTRFGDEYQPRLAAFFLNAIAEAQIPDPTLETMPAAVGDSES